MRNLKIVILNSITIILLLQFMYYQYQKQGGFGQTIEEQPGDIRYLYTNVLIFVVMILAFLSIFGQMVSDKTLYEKALGKVLRIVHVIYGLFLLLFCLLGLYLVFGQGILADNEFARYVFLIIAIAQGYLAGLIILQVRKKPQMLTSRNFDSILDEKMEEE